jgi:hypothetical protein
MPPVVARRQPVGLAARAGTGERAALPALLTAAALGGGNLVGVNRELDPLWGAGLRFALAAALLGAVMVGLRLSLPRGRALAGAVPYGVLNSPPAAACSTSHWPTCTPGSGPSCSRWYRRSPCNPAGAHPPWARAGAVRGSGG